MAAPDFVVKVIVNGDGSVGKSSLMVRYLSDEFSTSTTMTIGVDTGVKMLTLGDYTVKAQIWDTAGQERFRGITQSYYRGAGGAIVVYDITSQESFDNVERWLSEIKQHSNPDVVIALIGNKSDMEDQRVISYEDGEALAEKHNLTFVETSAKSGDNVADAFEYTVKEIVAVLSKTPAADLDAKPKSEPVKVDASNVAPNQGKKKGGCC